MMTIRKVAVSGALVCAAVAGGALGASLMGTANAATSGTSSTSSSTSSGSTSSGSTSSGTATTPQAPSGQVGQGGGVGGPGGGPHQANGITETALTGDSLAKATAAAKAAVPGGTVIRAETDADGAKYEVHMTKSDGSVVTVKLDANYKVVETDAGMR